MDLERAVQFLLEQTAAAEAHRAEAEARRAADEARHAQWKTDFEAAMADFQAGMADFAAGMADLRKNQSAIEQTQMKQLEMIDKLLDLSKRHEDRLGHVEVWSKEIKEKLESLIVVVDGLVRRKN